MATEAPKKSPGTASSRGSSAIWAQESDAPIMPAASRHPAVSAIAGNGCNLLRLALRDLRGQIFPLFIQHIELILRPFVTGIQISYALAIRIDLRVGKPRLELCNRPLLLDDIVLDLFIVRLELRPGKPIGIHRPAALKRSVEPVALLGLAPLLLFRFGAA